MQGGRGQTVSLCVVGKGKNGLGMWLGGRHTDRGVCVGWALIGCVCCWQFGVETGGCLCAGM